MRGHLLSSVVCSFLFTGCFTIQSKSQVNYEEIGNVSAAKAGSGDTEITSVSTVRTGFLFHPCSSLCKKAVEDLLDDAQGRGGDALVDLTFEGKRRSKSKVAMCLTRWSLADLFVIPIFSPWKKKCRVEAVAVKRDPSSANKSGEVGKATESVKVTIEKAKKCQERGGVWVNDSCQIDVD